MYPVGPTRPSNLKLLCRFHRVHKLLRQATSVSPQPTALRRRDGEETPFTGHALEFVSAAVVELES